MKKVLFFNFDGTTNEPKDGDQKTNFLGHIEDDNITNILKFHILLGGEVRAGKKSMNRGTILPNGSCTLYYSGIGTYGNLIKKTKNMILAVESGDIKDILSQAFMDFCYFYNTIGGFEKIVITGFSRGAAIARRFASTINDYVKEDSMIEAIFETVASVGVPDLSVERRPKSEVLFENRQIAPKVERALHLLALDEKRKPFQPTLMNKEDKILEIWFPGVHSDIGGGYRKDGLSDLTFRFFKDWLESLELGIKLLSPKEIDYEKFKSKDGKPLILEDDLDIEPNYINSMHDKLSDKYNKVGKADRICCVVKDDKILQGERPILHHSVADLIYFDEKYRPKSLEGVPHKIWYSPTNIKEFIGVESHKRLQLHELRRLGKDGVPSEVEVFVFADKKLNKTRIYFESNTSYHIEVVGNERWNDGKIKGIDGEGWDRDSQYLGLTEFAIKMMESKRRVTSKGVNWFTLCGTVVNQSDSQEMADEKAFIVGNGYDKKDKKLKEFRSNYSGELCLFANDLNNFYSNNSGHLRVKISLAKK